MWTLNQYVVSCMMSQTNITPCHMALTGVQTNTSPCHMVLTGLQTITTSCYMVLTGVQNNTSPCHMVLTGVQNNTTSCHKCSNICFYSFPNSWSKQKWEINKLDSVHLISVSDKNNYVTYTLLSFGSAVLNASLIGLLL